MQENSLFHTGHHKDNTNYTKQTETIGNKNICGYFVLALI